MIVYGTRGLKSRVSTGQFYCPQCAETRSYTWYKVRKWFTLYFIPLIPLDVAGEYLECPTCSGTFGTEAQHHDAEHYAAEDSKFQAEFHIAMKTTMILTMLSDGKIEPQEQEMIRGYFGQLTGRDYPMQELDSDVSRLQSANLGMKDYLADISARLNDTGKAMVFQANVLVAQADGEISREEEALLKSNYKALGMTRSQASKIRKTMEQES